MEQSKLYKGVSPGACGCVLYKESARTSFIPVSGFWDSYNHELGIPLTIILRDSSNRDIGCNKRETNCGPLST